MEAPIYVIILWDMDVNVIDKETNWNIQIKWVDQGSKAP